MYTLIYKLIYKPLIYKWVKTRLKKSILENKLEAF